MSDTERDAKLMQALLEWRRRTAAKFKVPVFYIFQERTLQLIVQRKPVTLEGLLHISGIAEMKLSYFGTEVLEILDSFLSPGERAVKEYAASVPVQSCCHLCHASASITCRGCGVVHRHPGGTWSTTTALLHQIKAETKTGTPSTSASVDVKKRKMKTTSEFVTSMHDDDLHCPLNALKKRKLISPLTDAEKSIADRKSIEIQRSFLQEIAKREVSRSATKASVKNKAQMPSRMNENTKKRTKRFGKKRTRPKATPLAKDPIHLNKKFWDIASEVKKRAREAAERNPSTKKRRTPTKKTTPNWIGKVGTSCNLNVDPFLCEDPPDLDACSIPLLKRFLSQNGFKCPADIVDASELRSLAKNSLSSWEVRRVIACEQLPIDHRHRAILRLHSTDGIDHIKRQFKKLSLHIHPDKNCHPDATHAFYLLQSAVQYLSNTLQQM